MEKNTVNTDEKTRDSFVSKWGFILACIGSVVGVGNIWMFPLRVSKYGGGSFLLPYFLFVVVIGFSGVIGEMAFGRATRSGPIGAFKKAVESRGWNPRIGEVIGFIPVLGSLALAIGYSVVVGWILKYSVGSILGFSWSSTSLEEFGANFGTMASSFGNTNWQIAGLLIAFVIMVFGISKGIEIANKIMIPLFFCMFLGLGFYIFSLPGAREGYKYILSIDPVVLKNPMTWVFALGQAFFSLSLAGNGTLIYGSYLKDDTDILSSAWRVAFFDTLAACLATLVIIPAVATSGQSLTVGGPGLIFIYLPYIFKNMPMGRIVMIVFFVSVFFAGITSLVNLFEAPIATLQEKFRFTRQKAVTFTIALGIVVGVLIQGIVGTWMDVVSIYVCPLGASIAGIMFFWVFGDDYVRREMQKGRDKKIGSWLKPITKYVFCGLTIIVMALSIFIPGGI
ncbi:MAG: sodium-dependent transporter [Synergistaceae bacterium]